MKNLYNARNLMITLAFGLLFSSFSSTCFAQVKLSKTSSETIQMVNPITYSQAVTQVPTPITGPVQISPDSPQFIQRFGLDRSAPLTQKEVRLPETRRSENEFPEGSLPIEDFRMKSGSSLTAIPCNDAPIGTADLYVTGNDQSLAIAAPGFLTNDADLQGEALTATAIVDYVDNGALVAFPDGSFTYTPNPGFVGTDQFQYIMRDASFNSSEPVTVNIEVRVSGNRAPIGSDDSFGALAGAILNIAAPGFLSNDIDQDGDVVTATLIADNVDHGSLVAFPDGSFTYTPTPGFLGTDQFQYKMRDSEFNESDAVTVTIQVLEGNRNPVGTDDLFGVVINTSLTIPAPGFLINDSDPDGDALTAILIADNVDNGTLIAFPDGSFTYTPTSGFLGTDQFQYKMRDSEFNESEPITVTIEVIDTGVLPVGFDDHFKTSDGNNLSVAAPGFLLNDIDQNGEALTAILILDNVDYGTLAAFADGSFTYTSNPGFVGTDQFQYQMRDASLNESAPITVTIEVSAAYNRIPVGTNDLYAALSNTTLTITSPGFLSNDIDQDGDIITATLIADNVDNGTLAAFADGSFVYTPNPGFTGTDQFQYIMRDALFNESEPVTVTIEVYEGNRNPSGTNDVFAVVKNTTLNIAVAGFLVNDYDPDGDVLTATLIVDNVDHGSLSAFADGSFVYNPEPDFTGTDQFQYQMQDSKSNSSEPVTVTLEVVGPNLPPVAAANNLLAECAGPSGTLVTLDGSGSVDPEGGDLTYTWYENLIIIAGPVSTPASDVIFTTGFHQVSLIVEDGCGQTSQTDITVTIEDTAGPLVEAAFLTTVMPNNFEISCSSEDVCSAIASSVSVIRIPDLTNPTVTLKNSKNYSLVIDMEKNTVEVKAPDADVFWSMILSNEGVIVNDGQVIVAKNGKNKYKFSFDATGNLISVEGEVVTLRCTAVDSNGNTSESEAILPPDLYKSVIGDNTYSDGQGFAGWYRNYPNPFTRQTTIEYRLENPAFVNIAIFDQSGRMVEKLVNKQMPEGVNTIVWDAKQNKPGVYYYRIESGENHVTEKIILIRQY